MATTKNITIDQGSTHYTNLTYTDSNKNPIDISGYYVRSQLRRSYVSANAITFQANIVTAANGTLSLYLDPHISSNLKNDRYLYDVELYKYEESYDYSSNTNVNVDTEVIRIFEGIATINPGVTR